ncbi:MAG: hypothetical protein GY723_16920 [bacterium]|nr:hypothetical protein [bacterium]MCP5069325.1 hypothetical protein [bacterium]
MLATRGGLGLGRAGGGAEATLGEAAGRGVREGAGGIDSIWTEFTIGGSDTSRCSGSSTIGWISEATARGGGSCAGASARAAGDGKGVTEAGCVTGGGEDTTGVA